MRIFSLKSSIYLHQEGSRAARHAYSFMSFMSVISVIGYDNATTIANKTRSKTMICGCNKYVAKLFFGYMPYLVRNISRTKKNPSAINIFAIVGDWM